MIFIYRVTAAFESHHVEYAIAGGWAVALHGAVRGTMDVDFVLEISKKNFAAAETALKSIGLLPRLPLKADELVDFREEYIKNKNLTAWSFYNPTRPSEIVDVIVTSDLKEMRVVNKKVGHRSLKVLAIPDLIEMKQKAGRPQDLEDVRALKELQK
jgi:hypothetical protein